METKHKTTYKSLRKAFGIIKLIKTTIVGKNHHNDLTSCFISGIV